MLRAACSDLDEKSAGGTQDSASCKRVKNFYGLEVFIPEGGAGVGP